MHEGAKRLLKALVRLGLDDDALVFAAALVVALDVPHPPEPEPDLLAEAA